MKKVVLIIAVALMVSLCACSEEAVEPMEELPIDVEMTDGDDDDEDCGQVGGGCPGGGVSGG